MNQKTLARIGAAVCCFFSLFNSLQAQSTAFTYQGRLNDGVNPANGNYELRFYLRDALTAGNPVGPTNTLAPVAVSNGLFSVTLDFGNVFTGTNYWLEVGVRTNGSAASFTVLSPRQALTPSPSALFASLSGNVVDSTITAAKIASGQVVKSLNGLRDDLTLAAGTNVTLTPSGNTLTIASAGAGGAGIWSVNGNNAFYTAGNVGIGASTPHHRLSLIGGPGWTANAWTGSLELPNASAIGWQANSAGQRFGMGHNTGGFFLFRTLSDPGTTGNPALYDFTVDDSGRVGIGTLTPSSKLEIAAQDGDGLKIAGLQPFMTFRDSNAGNARSRIQGVGGDVDLFTESYLSGTNPLAFLKLANNGNVGIGTTSPQATLDVNGSIGYGQLTKLDVADNFAATVRAGDFLFGYSGRRGSPGRALVDSTDTLDINFGPDWANTGIWGNNIVAHGYVSLEANRTYVHGFDASGFHWFSYGTDADLMLGLHRNGTNSYDFTVNGTTYTRALTVTGGDVIQPVNNNGLVKAMLYVDSSGAIIRCFNGITDVSGGGCGFTVTQPLSGVFRINFGFPVSDRFVSVTAEFDSYGGFSSNHNAGANYRFYDSTSVEVFTFESGSSTDLVPAKFMIILY